MKLLSRRLGLYLVTAWVAITVNFFLPRLMPGNPVATLIGKLRGQVTPQEITSIQLQFGVGLHSTVWTQYLHYWSGLFHGNLGTSITQSASVSSVLSSQVPWTIGLIGAATVISFVLGTLFGALLGWTRGSRLDAAIPVATFLQATPFFFLGSLLLLVFANNWHLFPIFGAYDPNATQGWNWAFIASLLRYGELPILTIVLTSMAGWMLGMRNMMVTMIGEDFVLMAVAKGLPRRRVIMHAARNAVLPSVANFALAIGLLVSGALLVEQVFNYPGVGNLLLQAVLNEDYPLLQGIFLLITLTVLGANLVADVVYYLLDPRTRTPVAQ